MRSGGGRTDADKLLPHLIGNNPRPHGAPKLLGCRTTLSLSSGPSRLLSACRRIDASSRHLAGEFRNLRSLRIARGRQVRWTCFRTFEAAAHVDA